MIVKVVEVRVRPGHLPAYLASQEVWNRPETQAGASVLAAFAPRHAVVVRNDDADVEAEPGAEAEVTPWVHGS